MALIVPMFRAMGYDVFNAAEFAPEYTADVGVKRGEKVDYAILHNGEPLMLIECKKIDENLDNHGSQLFRYFATTSAKFGILTNGVEYRFYTDLQQQNTMDERPFLKIDLLDLHDADVNEMKKFCKSNFDIEQIFSRAEELKYAGLIKSYMNNEIENPSNKFARLILDAIYDGKKTQNVLDKYKPLIKRTFTLMIDEMVKKRLTSALASEKEVVEDNLEEESTEEEKSGIVTTEEELEGFRIVRAILSEHIPVQDVIYRDALRYFAILYQDNNRKPLVRLEFNGRQKYISIPDEQKNFTRYDIDSVDDIYKYRTELLKIAKHWADN